MVAPAEAIDMRKTLPEGTYTVKFDEMSGSFYLEVIEDFTVATKIYGDTTKHANRILETFADRPNSTGVMLSGEKGSGKTLLAKVISVRARKAGIPTIVINNAWCGEVFNGFIQMIEQPTVIIFDEFEKVYDRNEQEKMLTLLDGVYPSKKLFILTCNDKYRVNTQMTNRPGRIFYRMDYAGLENSFIMEYCADNLENKGHTDSICRIAMAFSEFNFDILKALIEEMNRYKETPQQAMEMLNAKPEFSEGADYMVQIKVNDVKIDKDKFDDYCWSGNPLAGTVRVGYYTSGPVRKKRSRPGRDTSPEAPVSAKELMDNLFGDDDVAEESAYTYQDFTSADLKVVDSAGGKFKFVNGAGSKLTLTRIRAPKSNVDYSAF